MDLAGVIGFAIEAITPVLEDRNARVITDISDEVLSVRGDSARIQQVVMNLLSNSARYSPPGKPIQLSAAVEEESVVLRVKDEGRGISPAMLSEIFELFVQNEQGLERSSGGLGIGLTLVRQIVELHGGTVKAYSDGPGTGSEFVVRLPLQRNAVLRAGTGQQETAAPRRVLVVEGAGPAL